MGNPGYDTSEMPAAFAFSSLTMKVETDNFCIMAKPYRLKEIIDYEMKNIMEAFPVWENRANHKPKSFAHPSSTGLLDEPAIWKTALQFETEIFVRDYTGHTWR